MCARTPRGAAPSVWSNSAHCSWPGASGVAADVESTANRASPRVFLATVMCAVGVTMCSRGRTSHVVCTAAPTACAEEWRNGALVSFAPSCTGKGMRTSGRARGRCFVNTGSG